MKALVGILAALSLAACGPGRTSFARYPGAPAAFDRTASAPEALEIADKVFAAAGGPGNWERAKQVRWKQTVTLEGAVSSSGEHAWDRWNARHHGRLDYKDGGGVVVMYELFGDFSAGYVESARGFKTPMPSEERGDAIKIARKAWATDASIMCMPYLLQEPGAKLEYGGLVRDGEAEYHDLKLTFDAKDTTRAGLVFHAFVDKTGDSIYRVEVERPGGERVGYVLADWTTVGGLKFPATRKNIGTGEVVSSKDIKVSEPDDDLYIAPVQ